MSILRWLRGILGTAVTWAVLWSSIGTVLAVITIVLNGGPDVASLLKYTFWVAAFYAVWGAVSGGMFALVLTATERRRSLADLSLLRIVIWGAVGALAVPILFITVVGGADIQLVPTVPFFAITAGLGGLSSGSTLLLARRQHRDLLSNRDVAA